MILPLSDEMWARVCHLLIEQPHTGRGRPRRSTRHVLDGILWVVTNDEKWHHLPSIYPPSQTCYAKWLARRRDGVMEAVFAQLRYDLLADQSRRENE